MGYFSSLEFIQLYFYSMFIFLIFKLSFRCIRSASNVCTMYNKSLDTHAKSLRREKARPSLWPQKYRYHSYMRPLTIVWAPKDMISLKRSPQQILICNGRFGGVWGAEGSLHISICWGDLFNDIMSLGAHTIVKGRMYESAYCRINGRGDLFDDILALRAILERGAKLFRAEGFFMGI